MDKIKALNAANAVARQRKADVLFYSGLIGPESGNQMIGRLKSRRRHENVVVILVTPGGDPDASFKIGRALQNSYKNVSVFVTGWCKSAGTLIALAAHDLIIADCGELGPLDIQLAKADEIMAHGSGLTVDAALKTLEQTALKMFLNLMVGIRRDTGASITTKTAADLSARMVGELLEPIYRQIDPNKIGENSRAMNITRHYGTRLNLIGRNLKNQGNLDLLVASYPDHSFVIDRREAQLIFSRVMEPDANLTSLSDALGSDGLVPKTGFATVEFLSNEAKTAASGNTKNAPASSSQKPRTTRKRSNARARAAPRKRVR